MPDGDPIHLSKAALDEIASKDGQRIVLRGVVDAGSLGDLLVDDYQREPLPLSRLTRMWQALRQGESLPDLELGMRGEDFDWSGDDYWLKDPVYIIDGQQRRNAALHLLSVMPDVSIRVGAMIHFNTDREWERDRFKILNLDRSRVSANVLLRNMRHQSTAILTLYGLSYNQPDFACYQRVCWSQNKGRADLITARSLASIAGTLHAHRSPAFRMGLAELVPALDRQANEVRLERWRNNVVTFFDVVDDCFGVRNVQLPMLATHLRAGFLVNLAGVFSDHGAFWADNDNTLVVNPDWRRRLSTFPINDPGMQPFITGAASGYAGGARGSGIYTVVRDHLNKGRSTGRLVLRDDTLAAMAHASWQPGGRRRTNNRDDMEYPR